MNELFKICGKCEVEKALSEFTRDRIKKDGLCNYCKSCTRARNKKYSQENVDKEKARTMAYRKKNKTKIVAYKQKHKEKLKAYSKRYYQEHEKERKITAQAYKSKANKKRRIRYKNDVGYKINTNMSASMWKGLKNGKLGKSWKDCVDYTLQELIKHLKSTIPDGYTWEDYACSGSLHIDHIIPKAAFNITSIECTDFKKCWTLKNLRLLPALENISKGAKLINSFQPSLEGF